MWKKKQNPNCAEKSQRKKVAPNSCQQGGGADPQGATTLKAGLCNIKLEIKLGGFST